MMKVCLFIGFSCLIPLFIGATNSSEYIDSDLHAAISSHRNRDSAITAIALALPILAELAIERIISAFIKDKSENTKSIVKHALLNRTERFAVACGLLTIPITAFLPHHILSFVNIYLCLRKCRYVITGAAVLVSLYRLDNNVFTLLKTCFNIVLVAIGSVSGCYAENFCDLRGTNYLVIRELGNFCYLLAGIITLYCILRWLISFISVLIKGYTTTEEYMDTDLNTVLPILYVFSTGGAIIIMLTTNRVNPDSDKYTSSTLFYHHMGLILYIIFLISLSERAIKFEIIRGLVSHLSLYFVFQSRVILVLCTSAGAPCSKSSNIKENY